jgi:dTDP-4-dehydrorhamnose reductase
MKVIVVGAGGMLGQELVPILEAAGHEVLPTDRGGRLTTLDITDRQQTASAIETHRPDAVVNCAAYTQVDRAETEADDAYRVNAQGPWNLALACAERGVHLLHVSTDYVFDGMATRPYDEFSPTAPQGVYGRSKEAGERAIREVHRQATIVRTSWLYGKFGPNFVETMLKLGATRDELRVVSDQRGGPTWTHDLAHRLAHLLEARAYGTYHLSGQGDCTWYDFARAIFDRAGLSVNVLPQTTQELGRPAPRPAYSVMRSRRWEWVGDRPMMPWEDALDAYLASRQPSP